MVVFQGVVKSVQSGDTFVVMDMTKRGGPPPEKKLTLSGVSVPRMGNKAREGANTPDEPYAWEAREFLRKLIIGKPISFMIEKVLEDSDRTFCTAKLGDVNLAAELVKNGLARTRDRQPSSEQETLTELEAQAVADKVGLHSDAPAPIARTVVDDREGSLDLGRLVSNSKAKPIAAIVEMVFSASSMRVLLLPEGDIKNHTSISVSLSGIRTPALRSREDPQKPEPFAVEAKFFTESRLLHRDVTVCLEAVEQSSKAGGSPQVMATVSMTQGNIAYALIRNGFARLNNYTIGTCTCAGQLREGESTAKKERLRLWRNYKPQQTSQFTGKVVEVHSGDSVTILDENNDYQRIFLSSIRIPRSQDKAEGLQAAAKEFVRRSLIGKQVDVTVEYSRDLDADKDATPGQAPKPKAPAGGSSVRRFATIRTGKKNVAEQLCREGLCEVVRHRQDDPRSGAYDALIQAEEEARTQKKNIHSSRDIKVKAPRVNDLCGDKARALAFQPTFQRQPSHTALVDFVMNGARFKLFVPKEACLLPFALSGIRVPMSSRKDAPGEPFGDEAYQFARLAVGQREVHIEIETCDRGGTFLGHLRYDKDVSLAEELVRQGFASVQENSRSPAYNQLKAIEKVAKAGSLGIWRDYVEPTSQELEAAAAPQSNSPDVLPVFVTEIVSGSELFFRNVADTDSDMEARVAKSVAEGTAGPPIGEWKPRQGQLVAAQFASDKQWYRARVVKLSKDGEAEVLFVDYGNSDVMKAADLKPLQKELADEPILAHQAQLAYIRTPPVEEEYGMEAGEELASLVLEKTLSAFVVNREGNVLEVILVASQVVDELTLPVIRESINAKMLESGFSRVRKRVPRWVDKAWLNELRQAEDVARKARKHMWQYGDVPDSDEEDFDIGGLRIRK